VLESIRARLTLAYAAALAVTIAAVAAGEYFFISRALYRRLDDSLGATTRVMAGLLEAERAEGESPRQAAQSLIVESALAEHAVAILGPDAQPLAARDGPHGARLPALEHVPATGASTLETVQSSDARIRVAALGVTLANGEHYTIVLGHRLGALEDDLGLIRRAALLALVIAVAGAGLGGWVLAGRSLAPVVAMCEQARQIGAGETQKRLAAANPRDELGTLARTFNDLLDRLAVSFDRQRQFMADASHELRTPISIVRNAATLTLEKERAQDEYRQALKVVAEESRRLSRLVEDMMTLARADTGHHPLRPRRFCLAELLAEVARAGAMLGRPRGASVVFRLEGEAFVFGDEDLVRRMLLNLVENAVAHSPRGTEVTLALVREDRAWAVSVRDHGIGIPVSEQARVFDRFHRVECADSGSHAGAGLGLAIARWIAEAHGGTLLLTASDAGGTTFVARLPSDVRSAAPAPSAALIAG
jgi:heavy metal sensor kinase